MARLSWGEDRGVVYVEFLLAFLPLFLIFLALCQIALLIAGKLVVEHAAFVGARSAIVVLDDDPKYYGGTARGVLSEAAPGKERDEAKAMLSQSLVSFASSSESKKRLQPQQGARMQAIREAALRPLRAFAPRAPAVLRAGAANVAEALATGADDGGAFGRLYVDAAAVVTLHGAAGDRGMAAEPVAHDAPVTVRVTYLQLCGVPVVRGMICRSLQSLLAPTSNVGPFGAENALRRRLSLAALPELLEGAADPSARFMVFEAETTLPNQGALYAYPEEEHASASAQ